MNAERTIPTLLNQIREEILPSIAHPSDLQTTESLQDLRSRLHSLHYYCIRTQVPDPLSNRVEILLSTSSDLWHLIAENELMLKNLKEYTRVRTFSAEAEGITNIEELLSGEDTLRDVLINSVGFSAQLEGKYDLGGLCETGTHRNGKKLYAGDSGSHLAVHQREHSRNRGR